MNAIEPEGVSIFNTAEYEVRPSQTEYYFLEV